MKIEIRTRTALFTILFLFLTLYSLYQARFLILGPQIWIDVPKDGATLVDPTVTISGRARNVAWITLNDRQIFTDKQGLWSEKLILAEGLSIMTVRAHDRFGRESEKSVRIILQ